MGQSGEFIVGRLVPKSAILYSPTWDKPAYSGKSQPDIPNSFVINDLHHISPSRSDHFEYDKSTFAFTKGLCPADHTSLTVMVCPALSI